MVNFGNVNIGTTSVGYPPNSVFGCRYVAPKNGTITSITIYGTNDNSDVWKVGLAADSSNIIGAILVESDFVTAPSLGWHTIPITYPAVAGTAYWLCLLNHNNNCTFAYDGGDFSHFNGFVYFYGTYGGYPNFPPAGWAGYTGYTEAKTSMYATITEIVEQQNATFRQSGLTTAAVCNNTGARVRVLRHLTSKA